LYGGSDDLANGARIISPRHDSADAAAEADGRAAAPAGVPPAVVVPRGRCRRPVPVPVHLLLDHRPLLVPAARPHTGPRVSGHHRAVSGQHSYYYVLKTMTLSRAISPGY